MFFKKYRPQELNILFILPIDWPYFFHCLTHRPKKLTWCHLMYCLWNLFCVQFQFLKKLKYTILSSHFCLFQNSLIDLVTPKDSYFIKKKYKMLFSKKKEESVLNSKPIFLRSKDVFLSVVIFNLKWWLSVAS